MKLFRQSVIVYIPILCALAVVQGCVSIPAMPGTKKTTVELPDWVKRPPSDNAQFFYGIGEGKDLERAKSAALADIAGKLMTSVASDTTIHTFANSKKVEEDFRRSVKTQVQDTNLSHYEVVELVPSAHGYWALIKLSRKELIASTTRQWKDKDDRIVEDMKRLNSYSTLESFLYTPKIEPTLVKSRSLMLLLRSANPSFDYDSENQRYVNYENKIKQVKHQLQFSVQSDSSGKQFAQSLVDLLTDEGFKANLSNTRGTANIKIATGVKYLSAGREKMAQLKALLSTSDEKGRVIANKEFTAAGSSLTSNEMAMQQAVADLKYQIADMGVLYSLGLEKD